MPLKFEIYSILIEKNEDFIECTMQNTLKVIGRFKTMISKQVIDESNRLIFKNFHSSS